MQVVTPGRPHSGQRRQRQDAAERPRAVGVVVVRVVVRRFGVTRGAVAGKREGVTNRAAGGMPVRIRLETQTGLKYKLRSCRGRTAVEDVRDLKEEVGRIRELVDAGRRGRPIGGELLAAFGAIVGLMVLSLGATAFGFIPRRL